MEMTDEEYSKGEKVTAKAHGALIDIEGIAVANVNEKVQLQEVRVWFDPLDMFRQIAPEGVVKKESVDKSLTPDEALDVSQETAGEGGGCPFTGRTSSNEA